MTSRIAGLYAITPDLIDTEDLLRRTRAALAGGARILQYRNKTATPELRLAQARRLQQLCAEFAVPLIINDSAKLALEVGAAGAHLGSDDGDLAAARARLGPDKLLGASCYDRIELAQRAIAAGADHVAFGSFFASGVKPDAVRPPMDLISRAKHELGVPTVAIGGITTTNAPQLIAAGIDAIAVITALFAAPDVERAAREFRMLFDQPPYGSSHEEKSKAL
ncbi:MAG: thiamine phosphate synthase [Betaproteobacteria bacterium]|nr:thiamine phosphate synthase [Betaproteobacteria bacterium]MDH4292596.1 thiamine phosphate synthase [Betaproteobacteria bacterium]MDH5341258.1 thiamine phosphate synthase [Betaproteobacteria bacterium]